MFGENKKDIVASVLKGSQAIISEETHLLRAGGFLLDLRLEGGHSLRALTHQVEANLQGRCRVHTSNQSDTQQQVKGTSKGSSSTVTAPRGRVKSRTCTTAPASMEARPSGAQSEPHPVLPTRARGRGPPEGRRERGQHRRPTGSPGSGQTGREAPMLQAEPSADSPLWTAICRRPSNLRASPHINMSPLPILVPGLPPWTRPDARARARMRTQLVLQATSLRCLSLHLRHLGRLQDLHPRTRPSHPQTWPVLRPQVRPGPRSSTKWIVPAVVSGLFSVLQVSELRAHLPSQTGPRGDGCWRAARRLGDTEKHQTTHIEPGSSSLILCLLSDCILQMKGSLPRKDSLPQSHS